MAQNGLVVNVILHVILGNFLGIQGKFLRREFLRKGSEGWDTEVTSATSYEWDSLDNVGSPSISLARAELGLPRSSGPEGWFRRGLVYMEGMGGGTQASCMALTGSPGAGVFLGGCPASAELAWPPCSCGRERKLLRAGHGSCKRDKWPSGMLSLSAAVRIQPGKIPASVP